MFFVCFFKSPLVIITSFLYDIPITVASNPLLSPLLLTSVCIGLWGKHSRSQLALCPQTEQLSSALTLCLRSLANSRAPPRRSALAALSALTPSPEEMPNPPPVAQSLLPSPASFSHKPSRTQCSVFVRRWTCN